MWSLCVCTVTYTMFTTNTAAATARLLAGSQSYTRESDDGMSPSSSNSLLFYTVRANFLILNKVHNRSYIEYVFNLLRS